jgi:DNA replication and repair protein RecF
MNLEHLRLEEFRTYKLLELSIPRSGCRFIGRNASGKTTLLEAIVVLATTRSPRTLSDRELINWTSGELYGVPPYARLLAEVRNASDRHRVEVSLQVAPERFSGARKTFRFDQQAVRAHDIVGSIKVVLFSPDDLSLVVGSPSERRRHLDLLLSQLDRDYLRALSRFNRLVTQRNGLLKSFMRNRVDARSRTTETQLAFWDEALVTDGAYIVARRFHIIGRLEESMVRHGQSLMESVALGLRYVPSVDLGVLDSREVRRMSPGDLSATIAARFERQIREVRSDEVRRGVTLVGPHRDDVSFEIDGRQLAQFGSRGQQRLCVVALKLAEATLINEQTGELPILLLDDVLSELDEEHRRRLVREVTSPGCQLIVTSTEVGSLADGSLAHLPLAHVEAGSVRFE